MQGASSAFSPCHVGAGRASKAGVSAFRGIDGLGGEFLAGFGSKMLKQACNFFVMPFLSVFHNHAMQKVRISAFSQLLYNTIVVSVRDTCIQFVT